jgi:hypothetical protein
VRQTSILRASLDRVLASKASLRHVLRRESPKLANNAALVLIDRRAKSPSYPRATGHSDMTTPTAARDFSSIVYFEVESPSR